MTIEETMTYLEKVFFVNIAEIAETVNSVKSTDIRIIRNTMLLVAVEENTLTILYISEDKERLFGAIRRISLVAKPPRFLKNGIMSSMPLKRKNDKKKSMTEYAAMRADAHNFFWYRRNIPKKSGYIFISPAKTRKRYPISRITAFSFFSNTRKRRVNISAKYIVFPRIIVNANGADVRMIIASFDVDCVVRLKSSISDIISSIEQIKKKSVIDIQNSG